jgi:toxin ParE1/3/4
LKRLPVRWLEPASLDLIEIIEFIHHDRPAAARKMGHDILLAAARLTRQPRRGTLVPELQGQGISECRQIYVESHRVIYDIQPESIDILAVLDSRRDIQAATLQRLMR